MSYNLKKTREKIANLKPSQNTLSMTGAFVKDLIYKRVKSGKGVNRSKVKTPLKKLSTSYVEYRKKHTPTGEFASPRRSNLTYTGTLLQNIDTNIKDTTIRIYINDKPHNKDGITNYELAQRVSKERPFFRLALAELKVIRQFIIRTLKKKGK